LEYFKKIKYNSLIIRKFNQLRIIHCYSIFAGLKFLGIKTKVKQRKNAK